ncbi:MAG TPA: type II secretion system F family protein [Gemmatimonadaceae bacterium]|nr:type II secretion system F family protein [Gemmatimonadaceae bacterium]
MTTDTAIGSFSYEAVDATGRRLRGRGDAASASALTRDLEARGLVVLDVATSDSAAGSTPSSRTGSRQEVLEATRALAALLTAGVPLARALTIGASIVPASIAGTLDDVGVRISSGMALSEALGRHPRLFSPLYRGVVRAGERSGALGDAFASLARQLEGEARVRAKLLAATIYPMLLAVAGTITIAVLVLFVLPRFAELLQDAHARLPRSTAALLDASRWLEHGWPALLAAVLVASGGLAAAARTERGRRSLSVLMVRVPLFGDLRRNVLASRFARLLGVLLEGGAPMLLALDDACDSLVDPLARDEVARVRARVREGRSLHGALAEGSLFPPVLARLVAVGEESGSVLAFLERGAELCEERADRTLQRVVTFVEPLMIVGFGLLIAFVALSLLQAIYGVDAATFR